MTNLEAFIKAFGWNGGTIHQVDAVIQPALKAAGLRSISELDGLDTWLDLVVCAFTTLNASDVAGYCRTAYLIRFEGMAIDNRVPPDTDYKPTGAA